ncbi:TetR/AcrR family transcriptional regulator [Bacillus sp. DJP31]|uniref:TetR/AcrR family transcriptional regulator n=1 Tax=Bacillus sp. DJP31 TaxID=3409789 RepID=UPI003BB75632
MNRKEQIIEAATKLFAEKGYHATTMQEIADQLGIAKGSLYSEFKSKDDLLFSITEYYQAQMFEKVLLVGFDPQLNAEEKLIKQIFVQFEDFLKNKDFIKMQMTDPTIQQQKEQIRCMKTNMREKVLSWQYESLVSSFGIEVKPYIWELVFIFNGMIKEFMTLIIIENVKFDLHEASVFIAARMKGIVQDIVKHQPPSIFPARMMEEHFQLNTTTEVDPSSIDSKINDEIKILLDYVQKEVAELPLKKQLVEGLDVLLEELKREKPRTSIVMGILLLLKDSIKNNQSLEHLEKWLQINKSRIGVVKWNI